MRNIAHIVIGWSIGHAVTQLGNLALAGKIAIGLVLSGLIGLAFEIFQEHWNRKFDYASRVDYRDAILTAVGGGIGAITQHYFGVLSVDIASYVILAGAITYIAGQIIKRQVI